MRIKAIDTVYKGYKFRSRLEARWAVFFDELGIQYEYEKEGFDVGIAGWYLPDFWLPELKCWVEIKPKGLLEQKDWGKLQQLHVRMWDKADCMALLGEPYSEKYEMVFMRGDFIAGKHFVNPDPLNPISVLVMAGEFGMCLECGSLLVQSIDELPRQLPDPNSGYGSNTAFKIFDLMGSNRICEYCRYIPKRCHAQLERAYNSALSARFEHGAKGI